MDKKTVYHLIFQTLIAGTLGEGGDGWGYMISKNYRQMADDFEKYENANDKWFTTRKDYDNNIVFSHGEYSEESISFTNDKNVVYPDIIIEYN
jgi:hypothetical protein